MTEWKKVKLKEVSDFTTGKLNSNACFHQRQNLLEHCRQNKNQIDTLLVELRKELRTIMSGGKTNE